MSPIEYVESSRLKWAAMPADPDEEHTMSYCADGDGMVQLYAYADRGFELYDQLEPVAFFGPETPLRDALEHAQAYLAATYHQLFEDYAMPRISDALYARGYSREYADNVEADRLDRAREDEKDRQLEASARLRDAAPDLLAALEDIANFDDRACHENGFGFVMRDIARDAIAKVTR